MKTRCSASNLWFLRREVDEHYYSRRTVYSASLVVFFTQTRRFIVFHDLYNDAKTKVMETK